MPADLEALVALFPFAGHAQERLVAQTTQIQVVR
jgi:hypothetical protein